MVLNAVDEILREGWEEIRVLKGTLPRNKSSRVLLVLDEQQLQPWEAWSFLLYSQLC